MKSCFKNFCPKIRDLDNLYKDIDGKLWADNQCTRLYTDFENIKRRTMLDAMSSS